MLVAQLNRAATDLPRALVTRWLAWIRLFEFDVKYVKGLKYTAVDRLLRRPSGENEGSEEEEDLDDIITRDLNCDIIKLLSKEEEARARID